MEQVILSCIHLIRLDLVVGPLALRTSTSLLHIISFLESVLGRLRG